MDFPVGDILLCDIRGADNRQILGVPEFGRLCEIKAAGDYHTAVNYNDLVMRDGMCRVNKCGDTCMGGEVGSPDLMIKYMQVIL